jgi:trk system potassium uptake protein TrkA
MSNAHFVVLGCGRLGVEVARALAQDGRSVAVIDRDPAALERLGAGYTGARVAGHGLDRAVLAQAGVERAAGFAALTGDDQVNALAAHVARTTFKVAQVVAQMVDARHAATYAHLEITTVAPHAWGAQYVREWLALPARRTTATFGSGEVRLIEGPAPAHAVGQPAAAFAAPGEVVVVAVVREGQALVPTAGTRLEAGDRLVLSVAASARARVEALLA